MQPSTPTNRDDRREPLLRPPPPNFRRRDDLIPGASGRPIVVDSTSPVNSRAETSHVFVTESPASPDPVPPCSPVNTPTSSPPVSPSRVRCNSPVYIPLQDHQYALPNCPLRNSPTLNGHFNVGMTGEVWPANSALQQRPFPRVPRQRRPAPSPPRPTVTPTNSRSPQQRPSPRVPRQRRCAPSPPRPTGTTNSRSPYARRRGLELSQNAFPRARARNLFQDFTATLPRPFDTSAVAPPAHARDRTPSPYVRLEVYSHTRHPLDRRTHLTILPSWAMKAKKERN